MTAEEAKQEVWEKSDKYTIRPKLGGQQCGLPTPVFRVCNENIGINIEIGCDRSVHKNKALAEILFKLALDEIIK